jgi:hypothetical protein
MCYVRADDTRIARRVIRILQTTGDSPDQSHMSVGAVRYLSSQDAEVIPLILVGMNSQPMTVVNWMRCAFDDISERELVAGGERIDRDALRKIAEDSKQSLYARRLAIDLLEKLEPGTRRRFLESRLEDAEFGPDAIAETLVSAAELKGCGDVEKAKTLLRTTFLATVEPEQTRLVAGRLKEVGDPVPVALHLGIVNHWHIIGPFPGLDMQAATEFLPPEMKPDFDAKYEGKSGRIEWKSVELTADEEWLDFKKYLGDGDDVVAYAAANLVVDRDRDVEFRAGADDNLQLWLNGERVLTSTGYYQRSRTDRHRVKVRLNQGTNLILAKVCDAKRSTDPPFGDSNRWQMSLRIVDERGRGVSLPVR